MSDTKVGRRSSRFSPVAAIPRCGCAGTAGLLYHCDVEEDYEFTEEVRLQGMRGQSSAGAMMQKDGFPPWLHWNSGPKAGRKPRRRSVDGSSFLEACKCSIFFRKIGRDRMSSLIPGILQSPPLVQCTGQGCDSLRLRRIYI